MRGLRRRLQFLRLTLRAWRLAARVEDISDDEEEDDEEEADAEEAVEVTGPPWKCAICPAVRPSRAAPSLVRAPDAWRPRRAHVRCCC